MPRKGFGIYRPPQKVYTMQKKQQDDKLYAEAAEKRPESENRSRIYASGFSVAKIWHTFWPMEAADETEVLFTGKWRGTGTRDSGKVGEDIEEKAYTAYITPNRVVVGTGW